ncbi:uncharacterized protein LOC131682540 [Topomyia yanbarensis]|uniref:uncharacterized protein LOC131682540 n=1 Tax=Topomyia yanbarensis TaxID=2498891 RepID=UPI00273CBB02|nr:uncharacterized protein LOC131682540 [Topomyia yanbarensis]
MPVVLHGPKSSIATFALIDDGSSLTLIDQELAKELDVKGSASPLCLRWTGGKTRYERESETINIAIAGTNDKKSPLEGVRTVKELLLPVQSLDYNELSARYPHLQGLPIGSYRNAKPRILIGVQHARVGAVQKCREGGVDEPIAIKTRLGWTIYGGSSVAVENSSISPRFNLHVCTCNTRDDGLHAMMKEYFSFDSMGISQPTKIILSSEIKRSEMLLNTGTHLRGDRYETVLLWKSNDIRLPESKSMAYRRFRCLEKRMANDRSLAETLNMTIRNYVTQGYIRKLSSEELAADHRRIWYLPIFPVTNPNKPGKVRIVWDAAAVSRGISLNSALLKGPDQLASLVSVLLQFRENRVAVSGDIREMYHQILINEEDQHCQRFFWNDGTSPEPNVFVMNVMTFGACCSPSCAQFVKNVNAQRFVDTLPDAVDVIVRKHYVDDMLASVETEDEAIQLAKSVRLIHQSGGFEIRNWRSNAEGVLVALNERADGGPLSDKDLNLGEVDVEKVLGLWWCTRTDTFRFKFTWTRYDKALLTGQRCPTKREVLRTLMVVFDPLGFVAHFLIYLKVLLQEIWRSGTHWDEAIRSDLFAKWRTWLKLLPEVETVRIPRCYRLTTSTNRNTDVQLHIFVDASETGFGAVAYLRFQEGQIIECSLLGAKTRVAPLKYVSIPRLELQAAVLGCRMAKLYAEALSVPIRKRFFWTDSHDVMCWLQSDHRRYSQFVACRVSEILETTEIHEWRWISTRDNVADEATKWHRLPEFSPESRWYRGPAFLWSPENEWPVQRFAPAATNEELRAHLLLHETVSPLVNFADFSNWKRLLRVVAHVVRFPMNIRLKISQNMICGGPLSQTELVQAEAAIYRQVQKESFPEEIAVLQSSTSCLQKIQKTSELYGLNPMLDVHGVLRMRGRTGGCTAACFDAINPIILPRRHPVTDLIVAYHHEIFHHRNHETVVNEIFQKYRIARLRVVYNTVRRNCQRCKVERALPVPPAMGDLPPARLAAYSRPFTFVGVDFFGPLIVTIGRRSEKRWGLLVTCLTVRAIHLEVTHSMNTSSCILALRNFMARRGVPREIFSDHGTNFQGASREMREALRAVDMEKMMQEFESTETTWKFIPPASPHMGGSWERLIQTVKRNLNAINPPNRINDEELLNIFIEIENIVNSRPLTHVALEDDNSAALTPNHFLLGSSSGLKPVASLDESCRTLRHGWKTSQAITNSFWKKMGDGLPTHYNPSDEMVLQHQTDRKR